MRALPVLLIVACAAPPPPPAAPIDNQRADRSIAPFQITMRRTPCFGRCPTYTVIVHSHGGIDYHGEDNVAVEGHHTATAAPDRIQSLDATIDRVRFFELDRFGKLPQEPSCTREGKITECGFAADTICSSTSVAIITVHRDGKVHTVTNDHCAPSPLELLENAIDDVAQTQQWR
jgi:hypothetical protein